MSNQVIVNQVELKNGRVIVTIHDSYFDTFYYTDKLYNSWEEIYNEIKGDVWIHLDGMPQPLEAVLEDGQYLELQIGGEKIESLICQGYE